ncbi:MAG TPA: enoyl-CoA hydratase-related protein [Thermoanaerobaculia bacterium]|nr:enoyl-CoA hydratase-related protein [Thermoanaerobaculia bacterium]
MSGSLPEHLSTLQLRRDGIALHVTIDRPEVRNALSAEVVSELRWLAAALAGGAPLADGVRVVVLRGAGGNFSAGGDVRGMSASRERTGAEDDLRRLNREFGSLLLELRALPQVVIAAIEGSAMGGGMGLACISDVAVATENARLGTPEVTLGLVPAQIAPFLYERVGGTLARRLMLTGSVLDARQASAAGLVHEVVPDDGALEARVAEIVAQVARCAPRAVARTKALLEQIVAGDRSTVERVLDQAAVAFVEAISDEAPEGIAAFLERRPPRWAGPEE